MNPPRDCFKRGLFGLVVWAALGSSAAATDAGGAPGVGSAWTTGGKQGLGTSTTVQSKVWYTIAQGIVTEVYYPQVDVPNVQDLQLVITDSSSFVDLERMPPTIRYNSSIREHSLIARSIPTNQIATGSRARLSPILTVR